ncbi:MAG: TIGR02186 family protein [Thermodesulfobacteriota bacterium]
MSHRHASQRFGFVILLAAVLGGLPAPALAAAPTFAVSPSEIPITMGYHGATVSVTGQADPAADIVVAVSQEPADVHLRYKGKAAGIFWMKIGTLVFHNLPATYLLHTSKDLASMVTPGEQARFRLGYQALAASSTIVSEAGTMPAGDWFAEFVRLKESEHLYAVREGSVQQDGQGGFQLALDWPFQAQPGTYQVQVYAVQDGQVTGQATSQITVAMTGPVQLLSRLAFERGAVYGVVAIVIALVVGFAVGGIFKKGGGGSH